MTPGGQFAADLLAVACTAAGSPTAAAPATVHAVVFVDVIPSDKAAGEALLVAFVRRAERDPALRSLTFIKQADIPNHFILEETFASSAAYRVFAGRGWVRDFRQALFPHLGSPWDERLGVAIE